MEGFGFATQGGELLVKFRKLNSAAKTPSYAKIGDAGLDLTAISKKYVNEISEDGLTAKSFVEYGTGLALEIPEGFVGLIFPRSSISNKAMTLTNSVGVVDSGYRGEVSFRFKRTLDGAGEYEVGDKVGQLIIIPFPVVYLKEVEELSDSQRGAGGFGHTGR